MAWNCSGSCFKLHCPNKRGSDMSDSSKADCHKKSVQVSQFFCLSSPSFSSSRSLTRLLVHSAEATLKKGLVTSILGWLWFDQLHVTRLPFWEIPELNGGFFMAFMGKASTNGEMFHGLWAGLHHFYWQWRSQKRTIRPRPKPGRTWV